MSKQPIATCFEFEDDDPLNPVKFERVARLTGPARWAVRRNGLCLNKFGTWDWEPMPSERTAAWQDHHRFDTVQEAVSNYERSK